VRFRLNLGGALLNKNSQNKQLSASDSGVGEETALRLTRYIGARKIEEMIEKERIEDKQYIEAFAHTQLGIEKILWDRIVEIFEGEKAIKVREVIEKSREEKDKSPTSTFELIKWAHFLGAINDDEYSDLTDFKKKRNDIMHGHGQWYYPEKYKEALKKGIRFLSENGL
jgi:hypothetical protein